MKYPLVLDLPYLAAADQHTPLQLDTADNIDLTRILIEFEESYLSKYGRKPRLCRKVTDQVGGPPCSWQAHSSTNSSLRA